LLSGAKTASTEVLKMGANILSDIVKQKRDKQVDSIIISFDETKDKLEHKRYN
jgi:hypothetical protein